MISIKDLFNLVLRYAFQKKGRVFLTISGIIIGIFTFTFFIFLSQGLSNAITSQFTSFGVNVMAIQPASAGKLNVGAPSGGGLTVNDISKLKQVIRGYKYIAPEILYTGFYSYSRKKVTLTTVAFQNNLWPKVRADIGTKLEKGRFLKQGDKFVAVIGSKVVTKYGDLKKLSIGSIITVNGIKLRIVGILKSKGDLLMDNAVLTTWTSIKKITNQNTYTIIRISFYKDTNLNEMIDKVDKRFNQPNKPKTINIMTPSQMLDKFNQILGLLTLIILFISSISLIVGGINVMNTMYSNIQERINEISVMKALGAENSDILKIFLVESSLLGFIGAIVGFILAFLLAKTLSYFITNLGYNVPVNFSFSFFLIIIIITTIVAILFGTYPAIKAAKIDPANNLRDE